MNIHDEMSDTDVLRAAADCLSAMPVPSAPDTAAIIATARARRRRAAGWSVTGAAAVTGVALGVSGMVGAPGHQPSGATGHRPAPTVRAQLAAWTVARLADGNISVTINQFKDPAGLQSTLRADGVPASVTLASQQNRACHPYPGGTISLGSGPPVPLRPTPLLERVFPQPYQTLGSRPEPGRAHWVKAAGPPSPPPSGNRTIIVIDPTALPRDAGVKLASDNTAATAVLLPQLVYANAPCTG
jgi:hypothetical protein